MHTYMCHLKSVERDLLRARTARDTSLTKADLHQRIDTASRAQLRATTSGLRRKLASMRKERDEALASTRESCKTSRVALQIDCQAKKEAAKARVRIARQEADAKIAEERLRLATSRMTAPRTKARSSRAERASESDDEVRANLPRELLPLFNRVRRGIKGSPRKSRTEAFLQYVEENPSDGWDALENAAEARVREMMQRQASGGRRRAASRDVVSVARTARGLAQHIAREVDGGRVYRPGELMHFYGVSNVLDREIRALNERLSGADERALTRAIESLLTERTAGHPFAKQSRRRRAA